MISNTVAVEGMEGMEGSWVGVVEEGVEGNLTGLVEDEESWVGVADEGDRELGFLQDQSRGCCLRLSSDY